MREKVVGTTYVEQKKVTELVGTLIPKEEGEHGVPEFHTTALLVPEPTNDHYNTALAVVVQTTNGDAHRVGYLGRTSERKQNINGVTPIKLVIYGYSEIGMSDSFVIDDM